MAERLTARQEIKHADGTSHIVTYCHGHRYGPAAFPNKYGTSNPQEYENYCEMVDRLAELEDAEEQQNKGCPHCVEIEQHNERGRVFYKELPHDASILTTLDDDRLQIAFDDKGGWVLHFEDAYGDRMFDVKITHCPMCGKPLKGGE